MAKVIGRVNMAVVETWNQKEEERLINKELAGARARAASQAAARKVQIAERRAKEKAEAEANFVPFNMQLRAQLRSVMNCTPLSLLHQPAETGLLICKKIT